MRKTFDAAMDWQFEGPEPEIFRLAEVAITRAQSLAVNEFVEQHGLKAGDISAIGFHGQTVLHRAPDKGSRGFTRQLGDGDLMAKITGIDVVYDFRSADMAAGGQGAPLSAIYHRAMLDRIDSSSDTAILNLGGVANITWCDNTDMIAFIHIAAGGYLAVFIHFSARMGANPVVDWRVRRACIKGIMSVLSHHVCSPRRQD